MSAWDATTQTVVRFPTHPAEGYPGWLVVDCGCCAGIQWGGDWPRECRDCGGSGALFLHAKSRRYAQYPGGPFRGIASPSEVAVLGEGETPA